MATPAFVTAMILAIGVPTVAGDAELIQELGDRYRILGDLSNLKPTETT